MLVPGLRASVMAAAASQVRPFVGWVLFGQVPGAGSAPVGRTVVRLESGWWWWPRSSLAPWLHRWDGRCKVGH